MKKITLLTVLLSITIIVNATIYLNETFNYTTASLLKNASGWAEAGTIGGWANDFVIGDSPLTYSNSGGVFVNSGIGKSMVTNFLGSYSPATSNYYVYNSFNTTAISTGAVYVAFLYSPNNISQNQTASPIMSLSTIGSNGGVQVWVGKGVVNTANFRFATTRGSTGASTDAKWATTEYSDLSAVYFVVLKYDFVTGGTSQISSIYINPVIGSNSEPTPDAIDNSSTSNLKTSLQTVQFKVTGNSKQVNNISGVRVCSTWAEAVAAQSTAPQLASPSIGAPSDATSTGFTANWTPVANAAGYDVKVYLGTNLISTTNFAGQATATGAITGLMSGIEYTYKVIAKGDITNYSDSDPSASSSSVTTLDPYASNALNTDLGDGTWGTVAETQPAAGTYPSNTINGFGLTASVVYTGSIKGLKGETHTNRIAIDKSMYGGMVTLPTVNAVEQIEIHATAGSAGNGFVLKEFIPSTNTWSAIGGTYVYDANSKTAGTDSIYIISVSRSVPTKFRIENPTNGGIYLMQIITRTTNPALLAKPVTTTATSISTTAFTANWTAVANASGYKVYVYDGTTLISGAPFSVSGQSTESLAISGLAAETAYTYKVQATGDGDTNYSDSFLSFAQAVTTSTTTGLNSPDANKIEISGKSIVANTTGNFEIYSIQGIRLLSKSNTQYINTQLSSGIYVVKFTDSTGKTLLQKVNIK